MQWNRTQGQTVPSKELHASPAFAVITAIRIDTNSKGDAMRTKAVELAFAVLFASGASGQAPGEQSVDRVFHFMHTQTTQGFQEIATVMRTVAGIRQLSVVAAPRALALRGTA